MTNEVKDLLVEYDSNYQERIDNGEIVKEAICNLKYLFDFITYLENKGFKLELSKIQK